MANKVPFATDDGGQVEFYVVEQTVLNAVTYLLVTEGDGDDDAEAYVLKDVSGQNDTEAIYVLVEDEGELSAIGGIFKELMEDVDISI